MQQTERMPLVKSVMTPFPWYIHIEDRLSHAKDVMEENQIRHLPVTEDGSLVGVLAERDIGLLEESERAKGLEELTVRDACVLGAYVVGLNDPLDRVLLTMAERHIGSALVVKNGKLAGIFTVTDACRCFGEFLQSMFGAGGNDAA